MKTSAGQHAASAPYYLPPPRSLQYHSYVTLPYLYFTHQLNVSLTLLNRGVRKGIYNFIAIELSFNKPFKCRYIRVQVGQDD